MSYIFLVAVLENGARVLSETGITKHLGSIGGKNYKLREKKGVEPYPLFLASKPLQPLIDEVFNPLDLLPLEYKFGDKIETGYKAEVLPKVCEVWLRARDRNLLQSSQLPKAKKAELLMRAIGSIGIIALVDEAAGYQYDRERNELQQLLKLYISEELLPWEKTFPDIYYKELFRLNGWDFTVNGIKKRPGVIGTWTKKLVYEQLPNGVFEELKKSMPKTTKGNNKGNYHQLLTSDIGSPHLTAQINEIITIFRLSKNMQEMWDNFKKLSEKKATELELPYKLDSKGYTIETE